MKKLAFATLLLLLCSIWALALNDDHGDKHKGSSVQGCLSQSDKGYLLTDKSGKTYRLTGDTSQLSAHVNHEVQIQGEKAEAAVEPGTSAASSTPSVPPDLKVSGMKHVSETCTSPTGVEKPASSEKSDKPMSEKPPNN